MKLRDFVRGMYTCPTRRRIFATLIRAGSVIITVTEPPVHDVARERLDGPRRRVSRIKRAAKNRWTLARVTLRVDDPALQVGPQRARRHIVGRISGTSGAVYRLQRREQPVGVIPRRCVALHRPRT